MIHCGVGECVSGMCLIWEELSVLYDLHRMGDAFDIPTQNTINVVLETLKT